MSSSRPGKEGIRVAHLRLCLLVLSLVCVAAAFFVGYSLGGRRAFRRGLANAYVKQAVDVTGQLVALRSSSVHAESLVDRQERLLQSLLRGIAHSTTPQQLGEDESLMRGMHGVKRYRLFFPCAMDGTWARTNWPYLSAEEHREIGMFLAALPDPDAASMARLDEPLRRAVGSDPQR